MYQVYVSALCVFLPLPLQSLGQLTRLHSLPPIPCLQLQLQVRVQPRTVVTLHHPWSNVHLAGKSSTIQAFKITNALGNTTSGIHLPLFQHVPFELKRSKVQSAVTDSWLVIDTHATSASGDLIRMPCPCRPPRMRAAL